ncbi:MAG TPA: RNA-guided endonuclease TnpB family protein [Nitrososphaera sp.]
MRQINTILNYKFRLYPTKEQEFVLEQTLDGCRWVYNYFRTATTTSLSVEDMQFALVELKESHPWLRNYHSKMLQMVVHQIDAARSAIDTMKAKGRKTGKLKYKHSEEYNTFTYSQSGFKIERHGNTDLLWLSKVGYMQIRLHRQQPLNIKQVSVTRKPDGRRWFANIACEEVRKPVATTRRIDTSKSVGIDVGIKNFAYDSDGKSNPQFLKSMLKPLRRADRRLARRWQYGSNNYKKAKHMRARLYQRIYNRRTDFLHKVSTAYAKRYDLIFLERLAIPNMVRNHKLARAILDSVWGTFKEMLRYKVKLAIEVSPVYTSIECSKCHEMVPKSLAVRTHVCPNCGLVIDRDYNSAIVIRQRGRALLCLPQELREVTPVEIAQQQQQQQHQHQHHRAVEEAGRGYRTCPIVVHYIPVSKSRFDYCC